MREQVITALHTFLQNSWMYYSPVDSRFRYRLGFAIGDTSTYTYVCIMNLHNSILEYDNLLIYAGVPIISSFLSDCCKI